MKIGPTRLVEPVWLGPRDIVQPGELLDKKCMRPILARCELAVSMKISDMLWFKNPLRVEHVCLKKKKSNGCHFCGMMHFVMLMLFYSSLSSFPKTQTQPRQIHSNVILNLTTDLPSKQYLSCPSSFHIIVIDLHRWRAFVPCSSAVLCCCKASAFYLQMGDKWKCAAATSYYCVSSLRLLKFWFNVIFDPLCFVVVSLWYIKF